MHRVTSEIANDLVQAHLETLLVLQRRPMSRSELADRVGSDAEVARLLRHGVLVEKGTTLQVVSSCLKHDRQASMMEFLRHRILPVMEAFNEDLSFTTLHNHRLLLPEARILTMNSAWLSQLSESLSEVSASTSDHEKCRLSVVAVGTTRVEHFVHDDTPVEQALYHLKWAARQRSSSTERENALLSHVEMFADAHTHARALARLQHEVEQLEAFPNATNEPSNYHLTLATYWRATEGESTEPC